MSQAVARDEYERAKALLDDAFAARREAAELREAFDAIAAEFGLAPGCPAETVAHNVRLAIATRDSARARNNEIVGRLKLVVDDLAETWIDGRAGEEDLAEIEVEALQPIVVVEETPPGGEVTGPTPDQPPGLVAGDQPGAILGCRSNTLRPAEDDDGHTETFKCRGCRQTKRLDGAIGDLPHVCDECRPLFRAEWDDRAWNALGDLVAGGDNGRLPFTSGRLDEVADELFAAGMPPVEAGRRMALEMGWQIDQFRAAPDREPLPMPKPGKTRRQQLMAAEAKKAKPPVVEAVPEAVIEEDFEKLLEAESDEDARPDLDTEEHPDTAGYPPSHPWYYKLGGEPLPVGKIEGRTAAQASAVYEVAQNKPLPADPKARARKIEAKLASWRENLDHDIKRYEELVEKGNDAVSEYDRSFDDEDDEGRCTALHDALSLTHNHVSYAKGMIVALAKLLAETDGPATEAAPKPKKARKSERQFDVLAVSKLAASKNSLIHKPYWLGRVKAIDQDDAARQSMPYFAPFYGGDELKVVPASARYYGEVCSGGRADEAEIKAAKAVGVNLVARKPRPDPSRRVPTAGEIDAADRLAKKRASTNVWATRPKEEAHAQT